jgi:hypothetical protein
MRSLNFVFVEFEFEIAVCTSHILLSAYTSVPVIHYGFVIHSVSHSHTAVVFLVRVVVIVPDSVCNLRSTRSRCPTSGQ